MEAALVTFMGAAALALRTWAVERKSMAQVKSTLGTVNGEGNILEMLTAIKHSCERTESRLDSHISNHGKE